MNERTSMSLSLPPTHLKQKWHVILESKGLSQDCSYCSIALSQQNAIWQWTNQSHLEWPFPGVRHHMPGQMILAFKLCLALMTLMTLSVVDSHVLPGGVHRRKRLLAILAFVRLLPSWTPSGNFSRFLCVNDGMICQWIHKSMGWGKKDVTPDFQQWSYVFLALTHRNSHWKASNCTTTINLDWILNKN